MIFGKRHQEETFLIVGLGNPESKYDHTRHNVGFRALDLIAEKYHIRVNRFRFKGIYGKGKIGGKEVYLLKPQTYMNLSGQSIREISSYFKISPDRTIILFDDVSLPLGKIRIRAKGSAGGHNGIKSVISELHTEEFPRIKIGVGEKPSPEMDLADWVLSNFTQEEEKVLKQSLECTVPAIECLIDQGCEAAMSRFSR